MDKITKVQEVSSFIVNFDNKYWNEVILRLTIIGIRYVTNNYQNTFSWKLKGLNEIIDQMNKISTTHKSINNYTSNKKRKETKKEYNYNYSNSTILKNKENNSAIKKIKNNLNNFINKNENNSNNNSMLLLSERNSIENNRYYQKVKKSKGPNIYLKNKNIRNSILSLKQGFINENFSNKNINVIVSNFPFNKNNEVNDNGYNIDKIKNKNNYIYDFNQEQNDYSCINKYKYNSKIGEKKFNNKHSYNIERNNNAFNENFPFHTYEEKKIDKNNKFLDNVNIIKNYNYKNSSQDFISELRKMSHSKEYMRNTNNSKKIISNIDYHFQPRSNTSFSSQLITKKNSHIRTYMKDKNNLISNSSDTIDKIKSDISTIRKDTNKEIKEDKENNGNISTNSIKKKYNFKEKNDSLVMNFQYGIQNNDFSPKKENQPINFSFNNLKNQKVKTEKIKTTLITEVLKKNKSNMNFDYTNNKENNNSLNLEYNYKLPNTDRYSCNYLNEIQNQTNKKFSDINSSDVSKKNIEEENKDKIKDKDDKKI